MFSFLKKNQVDKDKNIVAVLDIGSSKICVLIAEEDQGNLSIIGVGHQVSRGVKNGIINDMDSAKMTVGHAIAAAESMAGVVLDKMIIGVAGTVLKSLAFRTSIDLNGKVLDETDWRKISPVFEVPENHELIHAVPVNYNLDGNSGIVDPMGMVGQKLFIDVHPIVANVNALKNLYFAVQHNHLDIEGTCSVAYASALASLDEDEAKLGSILIDIGGGKTEIAVFDNGKFVYGGALPIGGNHITNDIAKGLSTPINHAERLKVLYGSLHISSTDDHQLIDVPQIGEDDSENANTMPRSILINIIRPRMEEIFEMIRSHLDSVGFGKVITKRVVLTGGGSQILGTKELASSMLSKQVRLAKPVKIKGLPEHLTGPAFSGAVGLLLYAGQGLEDLPISGNCRDLGNNKINRACKSLKNALGI